MDTPSRLLLNVKQHCAICQEESTALCVHIWRDKEDGKPHLASMTNLLKPEIVLDEHGKQYATLDLTPYLDKNLCLQCVALLDVQHVKGLPLEDLPLYVNEQWLTRSGHDAYVYRLETLSPSKTYHE